MVDLMIDTLELSPKHTALTDVSVPALETISCAEIADKMKVLASK